MQHWHKTIIVLARKGKEREGKERKGKGREGKERKGKERKGKEREGKGREGKGRLIPITHSQITFGKVRNSPQTLRSCLLELENCIRGNLISRATLWLSDVAVAGKGEEKA